MGKYKILITNDDSVHSPLLVPFLSAVAAEQWCATLRCVVPKHEQSWIAQAATRRKRVSTATHAFADYPGFVAEGTPADCVSLGLDNLYPDRADFVLSGINLGTNTGLAFYLSSGTVGGARQAFVSGVRAAACSVKVPKELMNAWVAQDTSVLAEHDADWQRIATTSAAIITRLIQGDAWRYADFFSINLPWQADQSTSVALTRLERKYYGPMFLPHDEDGFIHSFRGYQEDHEEPPETTEQTNLEGDIATLERGFVSITPIRYQLEVRNKDHLRCLSAIV